MLLDVPFLDPGNSSSDIQVDRLGGVEAESSLGLWCLHGTGRVGWAGEKNEVAWPEYHFQLYWGTALRGSTIDSLHQPGAFRLSAEVLAPNCASVNMGHI